jgi:hypothetical protein
MAETSGYGSFPRTYHPDRPSSPAIRHVYTTETEVVCSTAFEHRPLRLVGETGEASGS